MEKEKINDNVQKENNFELNSDEEAELRKMDEETKRRAREADQKSEMFSDMELVPASPEWEGKFNDLDNMRMELWTNDKDFYYNKRFGDFGRDIIDKYGIDNAPKFYLYHALGGSSPPEGKKYIDLDIEDPDLSIENFITTLYKEWKEKQDNN